jgi:hypothetical protein
VFNKAVQTDFTPCTTSLQAKWERKVDEGEPAWAGTSDRDMDSPLLHLPGAGGLGRKPGAANKARPVANSPRHLGTEPRHPAARSLHPAAGGLPQCRARAHAHGRSARQRRGPPPPAPAPGRARLRVAARRSRASEPRSREGRPPRPWPWHHLGPDLRARPSGGRASASDLEEFLGIRAPPASSDLPQFKLSAFLVAAPGSASRAAEGIDARCQATGAPSESMVTQPVLCLAFVLRACTIAFSCLLQKQ